MHKARNECESCGQARVIELEPSELGKGSTLPATDRSESRGRYDAFAELNYSRRDDDERKKNILRLPRRPGATDRVSSTQTTQFYHAQFFSQGLITATGSRNLKEE